MVMIVISTVMSCCQPTLLLISISNNYIGILYSWNIFVDIIFQHHIPIIFHHIPTISNILLILSLSYSTNINSSLPGEAPVILVHEGDDVPGLFGSPRVFFFAGDTKFMRAFFVGESWVNPVENYGKLNFMAYQWEKGILNVNDMAY